VRSFGVAGASLLGRRARALQPPVRPARAAAKARRVRGNGAHGADATNACGYSQRIRAVLVFFWHAPPTVPHACACVGRR
jgi:hypothetical protein